MPPNLSYGPAAFDAVGGDPNTPRKTVLDLVDTERFPTGVQVHTYERAASTEDS